ncbi:MtrB/PioB family decaheme-associated outer membrane protein [Noviherbaspirillum sp. ST9]|uniref:MtrB/PioB family decaheme-associated outer membrane protein n=1 Tax=Noviherbaspirillum sp. ST9 TaxID=3401606 RepID=UPI003B586CF4
MRSSFHLARSVIAASIAGIGATAWAQDADDEVRRLTTPDSEVEIGVGYVSDSSRKFGDYTGLHRQGLHIIGNIDLVRRDKETGQFVELSGSNLGLKSRNLRVEGGVQGNYGLRLEYDEIPHFWSEHYETPFANPGSTDLVLPPGWVRGATTAAMPALITSMRPFELESRRKSLTVGASKVLPAGWDVDVRVKREKRDGNRLIGAVIGNSGGNPRAAIVPEPIDYTTDELEATARYATKRMQLQFGYYGSFFSNQNLGLAWQNPFASTVWTGTTPGVTTFNQGQLALPPDNQAHQISASAGFNFTPQTRLSGSLSFGRMRQDDTFLPYTINPALAATVTTPLPRTSLDGRVNTVHADLKLTTKLMPKLNLMTMYRYDERDNKTPQSQYWYIGGDSLGQAAGGLSRIRTNLPVSSKKQQIEAELDYHWTPDTKLKLGYDYEWAKMSLEAIQEEKEHTVKAEAHHHFNEMVSGGVGYSFSDRRTDNYNMSRPFLNSFTPAYVSTLAPQFWWDNVPTQIRFFQAPRKRDKIRAFANVTPHERVDLQFGVDFHYDDYHKSLYGLQDAKGWQANFDASVRPTDAVTAHVFTSYETYGTNQRSIALGASQANVTNRALEWGATIEDRTVTFGTGVRYKPRRNYEVGADLTHARSRGRTGVVTEPGIAAAQQALPLPELTTKLGRLDLFGKYQLRPDMAIKFSYIYERYRANDWQFEQVLPNTLANVIGTNQVVPRYNVHFLGVSMAYQF